MGVHLKSPLVYPGSMARRDANPVGFISPNKSTERLRASKAISGPIFGAFHALNSYVE
jgi:hypothetical protein